MAEIKFRLVKSLVKNINGSKLGSTHFAQTESPEYIEPMHKAGFATINATINKINRLKNIFTFFCLLLILFGFDRILIVDLFMACIKNFMIFGECL